MSLLSVSNPLGLLAGCLLLSMGEVALHAQNEPTEPGSIAAALADEVRTIFERHKGAVVKIHATDRTGELSGTGFFIDPNGTLLTSYSVGGTSERIVVHSGNNSFPAHRILSDCRSGIAILRLDSPIRPTSFLTLGKSSSLSIATPVITIAYPMDLPITPNFGMIAGFHTKYLDRYFSTMHIRANVPVQRGESGAPLINLNGEAIGIVTSAIDGGASCFVLPSDAITKIHNDFLRFGSVRPGWLGVKVNRENPDAAEITEVIENTPAAQAGLRSGDILLRIGDYPVEKAEDIISACFFLTAGDPVPVTLQRGDKTLVISVGATERHSKKAKNGRNPFSRFNIREITDDIILRDE